MLLTYIFQWPVTDFEVVHTSPLQYLGLTSVSRGANGLDYQTPSNFAPAVPKRYVWNSTPTSFPYVNSSSLCNTI